MKRATLYARLFLSSQVSLARYVRLRVRRGIISRR